MMHTELTDHVCRPPKPCSKVFLPFCLFMEGLLSKQCENLAHAFTQCLLTVLYALFILNVLQCAWRCSWLCLLLAPHQDISSLHPFPFSLSLLLNFRSSLFLPGWNIAFCCQINLHKMQLSSLLLCSLKPLSGLLSGPFPYSVV